MTPDLLSKTGFSHGRLGFYLLEQSIVLNKNVHILISYF